MLVHGTSGMAINATSQYVVKGEVDASDVILSGAIDSVTGGIGRVLPHTGLGKAVKTFGDNVAEKAKGFTRGAFDNTRLVLGNQRGSVGGNVGRNAGEGTSEVNAGINQLEPYIGVKQASEYLKSQGVPRKVRKTVLESFDRRTIYMDQAGEDTFGVRFYDFSVKAQPKGRYLYETFQPLSSREGAAIKWEWNDMNGISQWQVKSGTPIIKGKAASQIENGVRYGGGIEQWWINDLNNLIGR
ncbi:MAG: hypothetical protein PHD60_06140 [Clostridia bacterium]|nr:hypothetical protein [Clostridia bacterium]